MEKLPLTLGRKKKTSPTEDSNYFQQEEKELH